MQLVVRHQTIYRYASAASRIALMLRLRPADFTGQQVVSWGVSVNGAAVDRFSINAWGDHEAIFQHTDPASEVTIVASGMVETSDRAGVVSGLKRDVPPAIFLRQTPLTKPDKAIHALGQGAEGDTALARLHSLSAMVRDTVGYRSGVTTSRSTAAEALAMGQGVCQDHAHIFASAARTLGIPARYVVGYLLASDDQDALHETHGWAEAYVEGLGWVGFDATNGVCTTPYYVRLCCGLDAREAAPIKGSIFGAKQIGIDADVVISEANGELEQQMQQQQ
jgi:transglutaminase-like putative cysteine protease